MPISIKARNARLVVFGYNVATDRIVWTRDPTKQHFIGDTLDLTGTIITAYYKDGTMSDITDLCSFDPAEGDFLRESGELDLTATYIDQASNTFDCNTTIRVGSIEFIRFSQVFTQQYYVGDTPDVSQLRVEAVWTDMSGEPNEDGQTTTSQILRVEDITDRCTFTINGERVSALTEGGVNSVEAHFIHALAGEFSCSADFVVGAVEYLALVVPEAYWMQKEDTLLNTGAMSVIAVWTDLSGDERTRSRILKTEDVTAEARITSPGTVNGYIPHIDYDVLSVNRYARDGNYTSVYVVHPLPIVASWGGYETDTSIETNPIDYIWWLSKPSRLYYNEGETLNYAGAAIWASYLETDEDTFDVTARCSFFPENLSTAVATGGEGEIVATFTTHAGDVYESSITFTVEENPDPGSEYDYDIDYEGGDPAINLLADISNLSDWNQNRPDHFQTTFVNHSNICYFHGHSPHCGTYWDITVENPYNKPLRFTWLDQVQNCTPFAIPITINGTTYSVSVPGTLTCVIPASATVTIHAIPDRVVDSQGTFSVSGISLRRADSNSWQGRTGGATR